MRWLLVFLPIFLAPTADSLSIITVLHDSVKNMTELFDSFQCPESNNMSDVFTRLHDVVPTCVTRCMPKMDSIYALPKTLRSPVALHQLCANLTESTACATAAGCSRLAVNAFSRAFQWMCMNDLDEITGQIACIQDSAADLHVKCESECAIREKTIDELAANGIDEKLFDVRACGVCYKENIEKYCEIGEDQNLIQTIIVVFMVSVINLIVSLFDTIVSCM